MSYDDVSGKQLDTDKVISARSDEMAYFKKHRVYRKVPMSLCYEVTGKAPISTRWIDINKGDTQNPTYRSRFCCKRNQERQYIITRHVCGDTSN